MGIKKVIRKLILREKASSEAFIEYLNKRGVTVGKNCYVPEPSSVLVDMTAPWLVTIGDNVTLTHGVSILTHDYGWSVLKRVDDFKGAVLGSQAPVKIGNNVFVGVNTVITKGVTIGDNVIIGAGSVVSKDCESGFVYAGNPATKIISVEEYVLKREQRQLDEAKKLALCYREKYSCNPPKEIFMEYFMLFCTAQEAADVPKFRSRMASGGNYDEAVAYMNSRKPMFASFEEFLQKCYE
ncbi:MAG: acyltransferase [Clostridia bacterium]|nr:acyltransferase [Clostridia bacterium]